MHEAVRSAREHFTQQRPGPQLTQLTCGDLGIDLQTGDVADLSRPRSDGANPSKRPAEPSGQHERVLQRAQVRSVPA